MAINEEELEIANTSYTNKDFLEIYSNTLQNAKKISNRWNPTITNESDPGIVLVKSASAIADCLNYNIDKNILENFMPSATQESSMRKLCDMNAYEMKYHQSATTNISFMYRGDIPGGDSIILPKYKTVITNTDKDVFYTLTKDITILYKNITYPKAELLDEGDNAIEGTIVDLTVANNTTIQLKDLDDNRRIYFPETMIAENGIFITNITNSKKSTQELWTKVSNLNILSPTHTIYKFGFDSIKGLPYVEFPTDIASLIGDGLSIKYTITTGVNGNVSAGTLNTLSSPSILYFTNKTTEQAYPEKESNDTAILVINNLSGTSNGVNAETIDQAYSSYKKIAGTFNTLVTCRDYANAIYNLTQLSKPRVSNVQVCDRRTDYNYSNNIMTFITYGPAVVNNIERVQVEGGKKEDIITAFDLCVYHLEPIKTSYTIDTYNNSFKVNNSLSRQDIENSLSEVDCISHDYKKLRDGSKEGPIDVYCFKNYYTINAQISTKQKVNEVEQQNILNNVHQALFKKFNAREVDYGYEIPYDILKDTILKADINIKDVNLEEPKVSTRVLYANNTEFDIEDKEKEGAKIRLIGGNILAGRIPLFKYDNDFSYDYGQWGLTVKAVDPDKEKEEKDIGPKISKIKRLTTKTKINLKKDTQNEYILKKNEVIQFFAPNFTSDVTYPYGINYRFEGGELGNSIKANTEYQLKGSDNLIFEYTDSDKANHRVEYTEDNIKTIVNGVETNKKMSSNIIRPNFDLIATDSSEKHESKIIDGKKFLSLSANEQIEHRVLMETTLKNTDVSCYWSRNNSENRLFDNLDKITTKGSVEVILGDNEYFIYTNSSYTELSILGSGTRLVLDIDSEHPYNPDDWKIQKESKLSTEDIANKGLAAFALNIWKVKNFSGNNLTMQEMQILTLVTDNKVVFSGLTEDVTLNNKLTDVEDSWVVNYEIDGKTSVLPKLISKSYKWKVKSRLDLNVGPKLRQPLLSNQSVELTIVDPNIDKPDEKTKTGERIVTIEGNDGPDTEHSDRVQPNIKFNAITQRAGGDNIDMKVTYLNSKEGYDVNALVFGYKVPTYTKKEQTVETEIPISTSGYTSIPLGQVEEKEVEEKFVKEIQLKVMTVHNIGGKPTEEQYNSFETQMIMMYVDYDTTKNTLEIEVKDDTIEEETIENNIRFYNEYKEDKFSEWTKKLTLRSGINVIEISGPMKNDLIFRSVRKSDKKDEAFQGSITLSSESIVDNVNENLGELKKEFTSSLLKNIYERSRAIDEQGNFKQVLFYYNCPIEDSRYIDTFNLLDANSLWNYNNIANRITLPQIDFDKSKIIIAVSSRTK